jgi:hypothetical protein
MDLSALSAELEASVESSDPRHIEALRELSKNFGTCQALIDFGECSPPVHLFLISSMLACASKHAAQWEAAYALSVCDWCYDVVSRVRQPAFVETVCQLFGTILATFWSHSEIPIKFNALSDFFESGNEAAIAVALQFCRATIVAFAGSQEKNSLNSLLFESRSLPHCFEIARGYLVCHRRNPGVYGNFVTVIQAALSYAGGLPPGASALEVVPALCAVYRERCDVNLLMCLISIVTSSPVPKNQSDILFCLCREMTTILESRAGLDDLRTSFHCAKLLHEWAERESSLRLPSVERSDPGLIDDEPPTEDSQAFVHLLHIVHDWTISMFENPTAFRDANEFYWHVLGFWSKIAIVLGDRGFGHLEMESYEFVGSVFRNYIAFLDNLVLTRDDEILFIFLNDATWISALHELVSLNRKDCASLPTCVDYLLEFFDDRRTELEMSLLLRIVGCLLVLDPKSSLEHRPLFEQQARLLELGLRLLEERGTETPLFEKCVVDFISTYPQNRLMERHVGTLCERLLVTLRLAPTADTIVLAAVRALAQLPIPGELLVTLVADYRNLEFLGHPENERARTEFMAVITRACYQSRILPQFLETVKSDDPMLFAIDLIGIVNAAQKGIFYLTVCEWLVPHFCELFYSAASLDLRRKALKLWCCLTESNPGPRRGQCDVTAVRRIVFREYSSQGIVLFKSTANLLEPILAGFGNLENVEQQRLLKRIARVAANVMHNQYVCFGVFALYRDPVLHNLVNGVVGAFASFGFQQDHRAPAHSNRSLGMSAGNRSGPAE